jgi:hypothetical protein
MGAARAAPAKAENSKAEKLQKEGKHFGISEE